ncbi:MAG: sigma-70 family RNA polymerase sigma factor [Thermoguttaceae bacterium]|jgi:RNA polymerase sigma-70 factor (ECF subfamily)
MKQFTGSDSNASVRDTEHLQRGGQAALAETFMGHRERLRRMVQLRLDHRIAGRIDASDVLQDAYLDASRQLDRYLAHLPMSPFLWLRFLTGQRLMAIHRQHLGVQKRDARQEVALGRPAAPEVDSVSLSCGLLAQVTSPSMAVMRMEMQASVQELVDGLDPLDREVLALRHYEELTNQEVAEELGITTAAASKRYIRALERLKAALGTRAGDGSRVSGL